jgi:hypothetical protein
MKYLSTIHHLRKYPAAPLRPARQTKIAIVRDTTTALHDIAANDEMILIFLDL